MIFGHWPFRCADDAPIIPIRSTVMFMQWIIHSVGWIGYAAAGLAATVAATRAARPARWWWAALAAFQFAFGMEMVLKLRHKIPNLFINNELHANRHALQWAALALIILSLIPLAIILRRNLPTLCRPISLAAAAATASAACFAIVTVSLHQTDTLMFIPLGPLLLVEWLWLGCAIIVLLAALVSAAHPTKMDPHEKSTHPSSD